MNMLCLPGPVLRVRRRICVRGCGDAEWSDIRAHDGDCDAHSRLWDHELEHVELWSRDCAGAWAWRNVGMDGAFGCRRSDRRVDSALRWGLDNRTVMDLQRSASELLSTVKIHFVGDGKLIDNGHELVLSPIRTAAR